MEKKTVYKKDGTVVEAERLFHGSKSLKELVLDYMQKEKEAAEKEKNSRP